MKKYQDMNTAERQAWGAAEAERRREDLKSGPLEAGSRAANRVMEIGCTFHAADQMVREAVRRRKGMRV